MPASASPIDLPIPVPSPTGQHDWELATTIYLPDESALQGRPPVLVLMPGGGYGRHYFDLPAEGFSQAVHHAGHGTIVVTLDYIGAGDSSHPTAEQNTLDSAVAANHAAVGTIVERLRKGTLVDGLEPVHISGIVGAGQSLGGHVLLATQANHATFDGIALLGSSVAGTDLPRRPGTPAPTFPADATDEQIAAIALSGIDWIWAFHWETDDPTIADLIKQDTSGGLPMRQSAPRWGSLTSPAFGAVSMVPGALTPYTSRITVPVLLATGERDVTRPLEEERAMFTSTDDVATFTAPRMAHMHNFSQTRQLLWQRLDEFVAHCV